MKRESVACQKPLCVCVALEAVVLTSRYRAKHDKRLDSRYHQLR
jgi:hypothetical protein